MPDIRLMRSSDIQDILRIEQLSFSCPWPEDAFVSSALTASYVLVEAGGVVGYIMYHNVLDESMIINFAIDPAFRNRGWGSELLGGTLQIMLESGIKTFWLDVRESNATAQNLYQKYGFQLAGCRKNYYTQPDEDAVVMVKHAQQD